MKKIKILHAANLQLDSPFEALPPSKAAIARSEQRELLSSLAELSQSEKVDLVLLSGDLFDSAKAYYDSCAELIKALNNIAAPIFIAPGSQDFYSAKSPYAKLKFPENVYIFTSHTMDRVELPGMRAVIYGAAFHDRSSEAMLKGFSAPKKEGWFNILCINGVVGKPDSAFNPISEEDLEYSGIDYAALGHEIDASGLKKAGSCYYSWPGCPQGRGFNELGEKSVSIVELEDDKCSIRPVSIQSRKYQLLSVDITDSDPILAIHSQLPDDTVRDIYRIELKGQREKSPDTAALKEKFSHMFFELQIIDKTRLCRSVWDKAGENSLRGLFLKKMQKLYKEAGSEEEKLMIEKAVRLGLEALDNSKEEISHENK